MSILAPSSMTARAAMRERHIELSFTQITNEMCESICRTLLDRDVDVPVRVLSLIDNQLGPAQVEKIAACLESSPVRELRIRFNDIGRDGADGVAGVVSVSLQLTHLDLCGNHLLCGDVRKLFKSLTTSTSITHFAIGNNKIGPDGAALLSRALEKNTYLTHLDLSSNEIGPHGAESIAKVISSGSSTLQSLELYGNYLGPSGIKCICQAMKNNKEIKRITLGNNHATDAVACDVAEMLSSNYTLCELDLRLNEMTCNAIKEIACNGLENNVMLTSLCLMGNPIGTRGAETFTKSLLTHNRSALSTLDMSSCELGPEGGMRIAALMGTSMCLKEVNLSDNNLDDETAMSIARYMTDAISVSQIDLSCNSIGENGAAELIDAVLHNAHLSSLILHGNNVSRVMQKKMDNLLEERLARNRVKNSTAYVQHRARFMHDNSTSSTNAAAVATKSA